MTKIIRRIYPVEFSIGLLFLIFFLSAFISFEIFDTTWHQLMTGEGPVVGMVLSGITIVVLALILWEEFLFPVRVKPQEDEIVFRNHLTKLKTQVLMYSAILLIIGYVYFRYDVSAVPFFIWAFVCIFAPLAGKLTSGIRNYNDFLTLARDKIQFRNNEHHGVVIISQVREIVLLKDDANILHKIRILMNDYSELIIDLDEMELEPYCETIEAFVRSHYPGLILQES